MASGGVGCETQSLEVRETRFPPDSVTRQLSDSRQPAVVPQVHYSQLGDLG